MTKKDKVQKILNDLSKINPTHIPTTEDDRIDMNKIEDNPEIKSAIQKLRKLNVNGEWLFDNGFMNAGLFLGKLL